MKLSNEQKERMFDDLYIATVIQAFLEEFDTITVLDSGYAVELLCHQDFTRFHHDLDLLLISKAKDVKEHELLDCINNAQQKIKWISLPTANTWYWFREIDHKQREQPRQINIKLLSYKSRHDNNISLVSSHGSSYTLRIEEKRFPPYSDKDIFLVPDVNYQFATKVRLLEHYTEGFDMRDSDLHDFLLLQNYSTFDRSVVKKIICSYYESRLKKNVANHVDKLLKGLDRYLNQ